MAERAKAQIGFSPAGPGGHRNPLALSTSSHESDEDETNDTNVEA